jgi:hypothetical protein
LKEKEVEVPPKQQEPPQQQELLVSTVRGSASLTQHHSPQQQELSANTARGSPPPEKQSKEPPPPPEKQPKIPPPPLENQPKSPPPPPKKQPKGPPPQENPSKVPPPPEKQRTPAWFILNKDVISVMWSSLEPFKQDVDVHEPSKDNTEVVDNFFGGLQKFKHNESLVDLSTPGMTMQEFWQHDNRDYKLFEYEKPLVPKQVHAKLI